MYPDRAYTPPMRADAYLALEEHDENAERRVSVFGDLDVATAPALAERLDQLHAEGVDVRLDLSKVQFIDSTGIRVLVTTIYHAREDGRWRFEVDQAPSRVVRETLRVAHVEDLILGSSR